MHLLLCFTIFCIGLRVSASSATSQLDERFSDIGSAGETVVAVMNLKESACVDEPCHENAFCTDLGNGQFKCVCSEDLVGDGVHMCGERSPLIEVETTSTEYRGLKKNKKKKKATLRPTNSPTLSPTDAPTLNPTRVPTCFPGNALVMVKDKGLIKMQDLQVGDLVRVAGGKFSPVVAFGHQTSRVSAKFIRLHTNATKSVPLEISAKHFVFLYKEYEYPVMAMSLKKGDVLLGIGKSSGLPIEPFEIIKTEEITSEGIFAPFTVDGTIVVNGVVSSCYAFDVASPGQASDYMRWGSWKIVPWHSFIHMRYSPLRLASLGISLKLGKLANHEGKHILTCVLHQAHYWMSSRSSNWIVSGFGLVVLHLLQGIGIISYAIEWLVGPSMGPMFIVAVLVAIAIITIQIKKTSKQRQQFGKYWSLTKHKYD